MSLRCRFRVGEAASFLALYAVLLLLLAQPALALEPPGWDLKTIAEGVDFSQIALEGDQLVYGPVEGSAGGDIFLYDLATDQLRTLVQGSLTGHEGRQFDGEHLVYLSPGNGKRDIYLFTLSNGETLPVGESGLFYVAPQLSGDLVVWGQETAQSFVSSLWVYRISSAEKIKLDEGEASVYPDSALADHGWVVWRRFEKPDGTVWAFSEDADEKRELEALRGSRGSDLEDIDDGSLYYVRPAGAVYELRALELASGESRVLRSGPSDFQSVRASGGRVAWASWDAAGSYLALLDLASGQETRIATPAYTAGNLALNGEFLTWRGDPRTSAHRVSISYLFAYEIDSGKLTRLTAPQVYPGAGRTDAGRVAFQASAWNTNGQRIVVGTPSAGPPGFIDVRGTHPYRTPILGLQEEGGITGYEGPDGSAFRPDATLNRAQLAKMLAEALDVPVSEELESPFVDLGPDDEDLYPHEYVAALSALGIIKGVDVTHFAPWAPVTRAQLVTLAVRSVQKVRPPGLLAPPDWWMRFTLGSFDQVHGPTMTLAERNGLLDGLVGFGKGWDPWAPASRGEAAQVLWNAMTLRD